MASLAPRTNFKPWISAGDKARIDAALRTLRPLVPLVAGAYEVAWGPDWKREIHRRLGQSMLTPLEDVRDLFPDLPPSLADTLRDLANMAQHEDPGWTSDDADRAEGLASAIVTCTRPGAMMAFASVRGHHQEVFRVENGYLYHSWFPDKKEAWSDWHVMQAGRTYAVAAVGSDQDRLDLFILTLDGRVDHRIWQEGKGWEPWRTLPRGGQAVTGPLGALSREPRHLELFATGETGGVVHRWAASDEWSEWHDFSTPN
jgi:hypothetical protein